MTNNQTLKSKEKVYPTTHDQKPNLEVEGQVYQTTHDQKSNLEVEGKSLSNDT